MSHDLPRYLRRDAAARHVREKWSQPCSTRWPTLDQVGRVVASMGGSTAVQKRDRALVALVALTGARDNAVASLKIKHTDVRERMIFQDGRDVRTKFAKTIATWFFPVGHNFEAVVADWVSFARDTLNLGPNDPLFPATKRTFQNGSQASVLDSSVGWETAGPVRRIFKEAFTAAGMGYFNPHSFRHMLVRLGMEVCRTPQSLVAKPRARRRPRDVQQLRRGARPSPTRLDKLGG